MKISTKIILLFVLAIVLLIIFYPLNDVKTKDINGHWSLDQIIVDNDPKAFSVSVQIFNDGLSTVGSNIFDICKYKLKRKGNDSISVCCSEKKYDLIDDSLDLPSEDINFEGVYKIKISNKIIGGGKNAYYDLRLELKSKNKAIFLSRTERVEWEQGPPRRGIP